MNNDKQEKGVTYDVFDNQVHFVANHKNEFVH